MRLFRSKMLVDDKWNKQEILFWLREFSGRIKFGTFTILNTDIGTVAAAAMNEKAVALTGTGLRTSMPVIVTCTALVNGLVAYGIVTNSDELTLRVGNLTANPIDASAALEWNYFAFNVGTEA